MYLKNISIIEGPNIYSHGGVVRATVDISAWPEDSRAWPWVTDRLLACLPGLEDHRCSRGYKGGFVERLSEGTLAGHVLEHVAIELLVLAGQEVGFGKTRATDRKQQVFDVVVGYDCREAARLALQEGCALLNRLKAPGAQGVLDKLFVQQCVQKIEQADDRFGLGPSTQHILESCRRMNIPVRLYQNSLMRLGYGCRGHWMQASMSERDSCIATEVAQNKELTRRLLRETGLPVPAGKVVHSEREAESFFRALGESVVIKPCSGSQGRNVFIQLRNEEQVRKAYHLAAADRADGLVLMEEFVEGRHYRLLMVDGELVAAAYKKPAQVMGDGYSTLSQLIDTYNKDPARGRGHGKMLTRIKLGQSEIFDLACRGWTQEMVPEKGCKVTICSGANLSTGGTADDVTEFVHKRYRQMAADAAGCVGLSVAGVDMVTPDISEFDADKVKILEVNAAPGLRMHLPSNLGQKLVGSLFPEGQTRIPVLAVTGSNGKSTVVRMVAQCLRLSGSVVGLTCSDGVYVGEEKILEGDRTGPDSARCVLAHPRVEAAILETARGGILRGGLGYDWAEAAVVTNVTGDHLGEYGVETMAELLKVKALVVERVLPSGSVVINADDEGARSLTRHTQANVIYFSCDPKNRYVRRHLSIGGKAVLLFDNQIILAQGNEARSLCRLQDTALARVQISEIQTFGDTQTLGQSEPSVSQNYMPHYLAENMLAAVGAAWALKQSEDHIIRMLGEFSSVHNPGRWEAYSINLDSYGKNKPLCVILDYAHNPAALQAIGDSLRHQFGPARKDVNDSEGKIIGCIGMPGNRRDEDIVAFGRIAGEIFDSVYIKEDTDLRGRKPGEVANLMKKGVTSAGKSRIRIVSSETEAVQAVIQEACKRAGEKADVSIKYDKKKDENMGQGYTVLICYEHLNHVRDCLQQYKAQRYGEGP